MRRNKESQYIMSDSSDEDAVISSKGKVPQNKRKRQRLVSENSEHSPKESNEPELIELNEDEDEDDGGNRGAGGSFGSGSDDSRDEIVIVRESTNGHPKKVASEALAADFDGDDDIEEIDDDDDDDLDEADREDDAIIEELYDDEDNLKPRSSAAQKRVTGLRDNVAQFFQTASAIDLESIPGVSKKKVEQLLKLRPILNWEDLNRKIQKHTSAGINEDVVINAVKTIKSRTVVQKLMNDCMRLTDDIGQLVDRLPEAVQPKCIPEPMKLAS